MENLTFAVDPIRFVHVHNGDCTAFVASSSLYIANPEGSGGQDFDVEVHARTAH